MNPTLTRYDTVIVGSGHNGLVAAAYLSRAGQRVLVLEKNDYIGGATTSQRVFPDYDAYLSRYSYLMSLFPQPMIRELGIHLPLRSRKIASFTPYVHDGSHRGLLLSNESESVTRQSIEALAGASEYAGYQKLLAMQHLFAQKIWHGMLQPLRSKSWWEKQFSTDEEKRAWRALVEEPLGNTIEQYLQSDVLRGVICTDAKIGVFTHPHDESLLQNRTFIYHVIGNQTGEWQVPVGGMQTLVNELERIAKQYQTEIFTGAEVQQLKIGSEHHTVYFRQHGKEYEVSARYVLVNAAPAVLNQLLGEPVTHKPEDEGSVFKINLLLKRLPRLKYPAVSPEQAFAGTFHLNESYSQMQQAYRKALSGRLPATLSAEMYCHTLTDSSVLSPQLARQGYHTLTLFGLDVPYALFEQNPDSLKHEAVRRYLQGLNDYLADPIEECLATDTAGNFCVESCSPVDIARNLSMPRGNIFHNALSWFFAETPEEEQTWGVETGHERIFLCGSGAKRGGAVSGIPGRNVAVKVLEKS